jgi:tripartite-type tricarboxylate transporter receptor subunit TctC
MADLLGGQVQVSFISTGAAAPHIESRKLKALAVTSAQPSTLAPGVPTVAASGLPGFDAGATNGMWAPIHTPAPIINRLNQEIARVLNQPDVKQKFLDSGAEVAAGSAEQFAATIKSETAKWGKVIKDAGIRAD